MNIGKPDREVVISPIRLTPPKKQPVREPVAPAPQPSEPAKTPEKTPVPA